MTPPFRGGRGADRGRALSPRPDPLLPPQCCFGLPLAGFRPECGEQVHAQRDCYGGRVPRGEGETLAVQRLIRERLTFRQPAMAVPSPSGRVRVRGNNAESKAAALQMILGKVRLRESSDSAEFFPT